MTFSGTVFAASVAPFGGFILQQHAITIFRRGEGSRRFLPIRRVLPMDRPSPCYCDPNEKLWSVTIHPIATATFIALIVDNQSTWKEAESHRVVVRVIAASR